MAEDTWHSRAVPILEHLAAVENPSMAIVNIGELADAVGLEPQAVVDELDRLSAGGYLGGSVHKMLTGGDPRPWFLERASLTEKGARAVGMWPPEQLYSALLALIEQQAARADSETRTKLQRLRDALAEIGVGTATSLLTAFIRSHV